MLSADTVCSLGRKWLRSDFAGYSRRFCRFRGGFADFVVPLRYELQNLIVHYEVFYYGVAPHYEAHVWTSVARITLISLLCERPSTQDHKWLRQEAAGRDEAWGNAQASSRLNPSRPAYQYCKSKKHCHPVQCS